MRMAAAGSRIEIAVAITASSQIKTRPIGFWADSKRCLADRMFLMRPASTAVSSASSGWRATPLP
eukprot:9017742-Pyramimonas_sp.AAC.1